MSFPASAGVILRHGSHFYLLHRDSRARFWPHYWAFPGGKIDPGETAFETAKRELLEETGVSVNEKDMLSEIEITGKYIDGTRVYTLYLFDTWDGTPENLEKNLHKDGGWFSGDDLPEPMIPHIRAGFFALLEGASTLEYDGR